MLLCLMLVPEMVTVVLYYKVILPTTGLACIQQHFLFRAHNTNIYFFSHLVWTKLWTLKLDTFYGCNFLRKETSCHLKRHLISCDCTVDKSFCKQNKRAFLKAVCSFCRLAASDWRWEKDFLRFFSLLFSDFAEQQQLTASDFSVGFISTSARFPRCCRSRIVRESIKVYFRGIACSLNRDLNFKRLLFKWRTRRDPSLWKGVAP